MLPIININQLAEALQVERRWLIDHWIKRENVEDSAGPAPHFRDGNNIFFDLHELDEWAKRRSYGSDYTDTHPDDPLD